MKAPSRQTVDAWVHLARAHRAVLGAVEAALKAAGLPPLGWYDVLLELSRAPDGLRQHELEARLLLEQYNVSRLVDRLVAAGLAAKTVDPKDGRGRILLPTTDGEALRRRMWPVYAEVLGTRIGARLNDAQARQLADLLAALAGHAA